MRSLLRTAIVGALAVVLGMGCSSVLGLGDFDFSTQTDAGSDTSHVDLDANAGGDGDDSGCGNLDTECYRCVPATTEQFLNSCGDGTCEPFDRNRLNGYLLPDGALPPLPDSGG